MCATLIHRGYLRCACVAIQILVLVIVALVAVLTRWTLPRVDQRPVPLLMLFCALLVSVFILGLILLQLTGDAR